MASTRAAAIRVRRLAPCSIPNTIHKPLGKCEIAADPLDCERGYPNGSRQMNAASSRAAKHALRCREIGTQVLLSKRPVQRWPGTILADANASGVASGSRSQPPTEPELMALRLMLQQPSTTAVTRAMVESLREKGLVERRDGLLSVTSRGHSALLHSDSRPR